MGRAGEKEAEKFLKKSGYQILDTNYHTFFGEADIVCQKDEYIIFVEVKTRTDDSFGMPSEAVTIKKQERYFKIATEYVCKKGYNQKQIRFDVIEIENGKINHIIDAFSM